ncbi:6-carboxytetrahydropterin synthase QueD [Mycobacteroides abscessus]
MEISREFTFEAAHHLPNVPPAHKCSRIHGHSYRVQIALEGPIDPRYGWVVDYADIDQAYLQIHSILDHQLLNTIDGLENPTSENLAVWIWERLDSLPLLAAVTVWETPRSTCIYRGPS